MPPNAQADFTDALRRHVHQSRVSEATDPSPLCGAPAHRSGGTRRPMGTPQQRYLPRTIASDRGDDTEPSVAHHERTLAQSAAHLVAVAHGRRAARAAMAGERFRWNQRIGGGRNPAPTPLELGEPPDQNVSAAHARTRAHRQHKLNLAHFGAAFRVWCRATARNGALSVAEIVSQPVPTF